MLKIISLVILLIQLAACSSTKSPSIEEDSNRNIKTAKINSQLGITYLEQGNVQRAKQKLLLALSEGPNIPETWYSMAYFYEATGNHQQAKTYYLKAVSIAPHRGDVQNNYGTFLCRSGDYHGAIQRFLLAVKDTNYLNPAAAYENAGLCALKIPDATLASHYFNQALLQDATRPTSLLQLAELNYKKGNYTIAKEKLSQFLAVSAPTIQSVTLENRLEKQSTVIR
ncbi:MAG: type IV pilus biogenesis/stability protein PilW [Gammaproteobacteria bacterium RIFCSPHIGHO2_12_FULL_41_20]|nr:MAG: type IV pilus biogenesis/stability protein PilW [Gammaproteobacteria bacterium RIFCSPHIGHO2_12_FULL_41_20]